VTPRTETLAAASAAVTDLARVLAGDGKLHTIERGAGAAVVARVLKVLYPDAPMPRSQDWAFGCFNCGSALAAPAQEGASSDGL